MIQHLRDEVEARKSEKAHSWGLQGKSQQGKEPRDSLVGRRPSPPVERRRAVALLVRQDLERVVGELALEDGIVEGAAVAAGAEADAAATEKLSSGAPCSPSSVSAEPSTAAFAGSKVDLSLSRARALSRTCARTHTHTHVISFSLTTASLLCLSLNEQSAALLQKALCKVQL